ncbi:MAG: hypothetical protein ACD_11C00020G0021 [uncultured bacterium]|nr:MAG: hypothetical protein ACD_11C00020G0021 [uncultured bacterium]HBR71306.1 primosomal protein N' [Candidatus Moranbacteria bacterium]
MENKAKKFIIDVIPLARISLSRQQFFSYLHNQEISPGTLVNIPLFRRIIQGIVLCSRTDFERLGNFQLKKIISIEQEDFLSEKQLALANFISDYYLSSLGIALRHFIPKAVKARIVTSNQQLVTGKKNIVIKLTPAQELAVQEITNFSNSKFLLYGPASAGKTEVYLESIARIKKQHPDSQFLILLPELILTPQAIERYSAKFFPEKLTLLHSQLSKGEFFLNWQKIRSGEATIIIGTRAAIFAPYKNLRLIVVDEEQDISFKQWDMNPRYDARIVAEKLAELHSAKIVFGSATPRVENFYRAQNKEIKLLSLPYFNNKNNIDVEVVDMRKEKWTDFSGKKKANYSFLSLKLQEEISYALKNKLQTILFVNHQGVSRFSVCANCKTVLRCPKCQRALVFDKNGEYSCLHCSYKSGAFVNCSKCNGLEFKNVGIGTGTVEREIRKKFPQASVFSMDAFSSKKPGSRENLYKDFSENKIDILIGTQMITKNWDIPTVGLVGIVDADSLSTIPDFLVDEQSFQHIMQVIGRTGRNGSKFKGKAIIQTYSPDSFIIKKSAERDYESFYQKQIKEKSALHYPPFGKIIKLVFSHPDISKSEKEAKKTYDILNEKIGNTENVVQIIGPLSPLISNVRGKHRKQIIIKIKNSQKDIPLEIKKILEKLSSDWIIDIDPIQIA